MLLDRVKHFPLIEKQVEEGLFSSKARDDWISRAVHAVLLTLGNDILLSPKLARITAILEFLCAASRTKQIHPKEWQATRNIIIEEYNKSDFRQQHTRKHGAKQQSGEQEQTVKRSRIEVPTNDTLPIFDNISIRKEVENIIYVTSGQDASNGDLKIGYVAAYSNPTLFTNEKVVFNNGEYEKHVSDERKVATSTAIIFNDSVSRFTASLRNSLDLVNGTMFNSTKSSFPHVNISPTSQDSRDNSDERKDVLTETKRTTTLIPSTTYFAYIRENVFPERENIRQKVAALVLSLLTGVLTPIVGEQGVFTSKTVQSQQSSHRLDVSSSTTFASKHVSNSFLFSFAAPSLSLPHFSSIFLPLLNIYCKQQIRTIQRLIHRRDVLWVSLMNLQAGENRDKSQNFRTMRYANISLLSSRAYQFWIASSSLSMDSLSISRAPSITDLCLSSSLQR